MKASAQVFHVGKHSLSSDDDRTDKKFLQDDYSKNECKGIRIIQNESYQNFYVQIRLGLRKMD